MMLLIIYKKNYYFMKHQLFVLNMWIGRSFSLDNSQMSLSRLWFFLHIFVKVKLYQSDIENYMSNFKMGVDPFSRQ